MPNTWPCIFNHEHQVSMQAGRQCDGQCKSYTRRRVESLQGGAAAHLAMEKNLLGPAS